MPGSEQSPDEYLTCTVMDGGSGLAVFVAQGQFESELDLISAFRMVRAEKAFFYVMKVPVQRRVLMLVFLVP